MHRISLSQSRSRRQVKKAGGGMSDISNKGGGGVVKGFFGQWATNIGMTTLPSSLSSTTAGAEGIVPIVVDADVEGVWIGWT